MKVVTSGIILAISMMSGVAIAGPTLGEDFEQCMVKAIVYTGSESENKHLAELGDPATILELDVRSKYPYTPAQAATPSNPGHGQSGIPPGAQVALTPASDQTPALKKCQDAAKREYNLITQANVDNFNAVLKKQNKSLVILYPDI